MKKDGIRKQLEDLLEDESWLLLPENKEILARIKKGLAEDATIDFASLKKQLKLK